MARLRPQIDALPSRISYSSLQIGEETLYRRDLFDVRFQQASDDALGDECAQVLTGVSDVEAGRYEGGLKSWECAIDLVGALQRQQPELDGKTVFEVGCGTALPSCYLLQRCFATKASATFVLQDHDAEGASRTRSSDAAVFSLMTLPNILLAYAAATGQIDPTEDTLELSDELLAGFRSSAVKLRFVSGDWTTFKLEVAADLVLTSETVYRDASIPALVTLLKSTCARDATTLLAAKTVYFGLDGGELAFRRHADGAIEEVWRGGSEGSGGVDRVVLSVRWA